MKNKYETPEIRIITCVPYEDILNGSDTDIDGSDLFAEE